MTGAEVLDRYPVVPAPGTVREMVADDRTELTGVLGIIPALYPGGDWWLRRRLDEVLANRAGCTLIEANGELVGAALVKRKSPSVAKLSTFYISPSGRGNGLGSQLIDSVMVNLSLAGVEEVYVTVAHHLAEELQLLGPRGFTPTAFERDRYGNGRHEVVLSHVSA